MSDEFDKFHLHVLIQTYILACRELRRKRKVKKNI
jgi:hypothetical protein